jgi:hypothetical protein
MVQSLLRNCLGDALRKRVAVRRRLKVNRFTIPRLLCVVTAI